MTDSERDKQEAARRTLRLGHYVGFLAIAWTIIAGISLMWNLREQRGATLEAARIQARIAFEKDVLYRRWNAMHGGVYVPVTETTPPNPHLDVPERDIETPGGRALTKVNPAYMTRQVHELGAEQAGVQGHITSLNPIRLENAADPWETAALKAFENGAAEYASVEVVHGEDHMRLMRPLVTEKGCLKCHAAQGYAEGDIRGGISVSIPLARLQAVAGSNVLTLYFGHGGLWILGLAGLGAATRQIRRHIREHDRAEEVRERVLHDMGERVKELRCMYGVADSIRERSALEEVFQDVVALLPPGWQHPEIARGRIHFGGRDYVSEPFERTKWSQASDIIVDGERRGFVEVCYLEQRPDLDEGPFLREERTLINSIAHALSEAVERKHAEAAEAVRTAELEQQTVKLERSRRAAMSMMEDAEQARKVAEAVREELRLQGAALAAAANAIVITDRDGCIAWVNPAFTSLTGFASGEVVGQNPRALKSGRHDAVFYQELWRTILAGNVWHGEMVNRRKDGSLYTEEMTITPVRDTEGEITNFIAIKQDVSERKRAEKKLQEGTDMKIAALRRERRAAMELEAAMEQLEAATRDAEAASRSKSEFLANMSHEIRTPMTAILGFTENLLDSDQSDSDRLSAVHTVRRNGEHLLQIINDILDISKIEAGKLDVERIRCSPVQLVADVKSLMQVRADAKNLPFLTEYIGPVPETIESDPTRLKQILVNLIGNAIKFTEAGGVRLVTRFVEDAEDDQGGSPREPTVQFDVVDTGLGMTEEQVDHLFQAFTQADTTTTRKFGGTGLGLMISKRLAELLGGTITVESKPNEGSTFRLTITTGPLDGVKMLDDLATATIAQPDDTTAAKGDAAKLDCRILLAEDGADNQRLISFHLKKAGAKVAVVENGKLAVDAALATWYRRREDDPEHPFDVILMDMQMPVMDGYEATGLLRQKGYAGPIIALTAHAMAGDREKYISAGCDDYASKPIDRQKLIETIQTHTQTATVSASA